MFRINFIVADNFHIPYPDNSSAVQAFNTDTYHLLANKYLAVTSYMHENARLMCLSILCPTTHSWTI